MEEPKIQNFAIKITKETAPDGKFRFSVDSRNEGISDAEIILIVEAWLEKVRETWKDKIKQNMVFFGQK